jgi:predicted ATPase
MLQKSLFAFLAAMMATIAWQWNALQTCQETIIKQHRVFEDQFQEHERKIEKLRELILKLEAGKQ